VLVLTSYLRSGGEWDSPGSAPRAGPGVERHAPVRCVRHEPEAVESSCTATGRRQYRGRDTGAAEDGERSLDARPVLHGRDLGARTMCRLQQPRRRAERCAVCRLRGRDHEVAQPRHQDSTPEIGRCARGVSQSRPCCAIDPAWHACHQSAAPASVPGFGSVPRVRRRPSADSARAAPARRALHRTARPGRWPGPCEASPWLLASIHYICRGLLPPVSRGS
jgi:hypothetical protein